MWVNHKVQSEHKNHKIVRWEPRNVFMKGVILEKGGDVLVEQETSY